MHWWVSDLYQSNPVLLGSWIFWVIFSICLHELGHGWMAIRCGDDTPIHTGHMTWNPLVHMGTVSLLMFAVFGFCWGLMPVNPSNFRRRHDEARVAFAGPAQNLGIALVTAILYVGWERVAPGKFDVNVIHNVGTFLWVPVGMNIFMVLFNLVPIPPLDGSRILADFVPSYGRLWYNERGAIIALVAFILLMNTAGGAIMGIAGAISHWLITLVEQTMGVHHWRP